MICNVRSYFAKLAVLAITVAQLNKVNCCHYPNGENLLLSFLHFVKLL